MRFCNSSRFTCCPSQGPVPERADFIEVPLIGNALPDVRLEFEDPVPPARYLSSLPARISST